MEPDILLLCDARTDERKDKHPKWDGHYQYRKNGEKEANHAHCYEVC